MGCDIHLYCEKLIKINDKKQWWCCDYWELNPYYGIYIDESQYEHMSIYTERDYELFGILAGVRDTSVKPIKHIKGLPDDVSGVVKRASEDWGIDGHSHTWYTAKELFDYDKEHPGSPLHYLVKCVKRKMREEFYIWKFYDKETKKAKYEEFAESFRVVFWFDN